MDLTRRRFFQALAASAVAAGVSLPVGFPDQPMAQPVGIDSIYNNDQFLWLVDTYQRLFQAEWTGGYNHTAWIDITPARKQS